MIKPHDVLPIWSGDDQWQEFKLCFIQSDGRVIDNGNNNISHSEGQGYAMVIATALHDKKTFDRLWQWTRNNIGTRDDALFAWRWHPFKPHTPDTNNASDGDLLIAWALIRAAKLWPSGDYRQQAMTQLKAIENVLVRKYTNTLLLPAEFGFIQEGKITLNMSYYIYPALYEAALFQPQGPWKDLFFSGLDLQPHTNNALNLPADWNIFSSKIRAIVQPQKSPKKHSTFGYEAIRIPLYLCWVNQCDRLPYLKKFWSENNQPKAWISDNVQAKYPLNSGGMAIKDLLLGQSIKKTHQFNQCHSKSKYYSAILSLLAQLAQRESRAYRP